MPGTLKDMEAEASIRKTITAVLHEGSIPELESLLSDPLCKEFAQLVSDGRKVVSEWSIMEVLIIQLLVPPQHGRVSQVRHIMRAVLSGDPERVFQVAGVSWHSMDYDMFDERLGIRLLMLAARTKQTKVVKKFLYRGASILHVDRQGHTVMHHAATGGCPEVVDLLLQHAASVDATGSRGWTPIMEAVLNHRVEAVRLMIPYSQRIGVTFVMHSNILGSGSALWLATYLGHEDIVDLLIQGGASVNPLFEETPLMIAIRKNHHSLATRLLRAGADPNTIVRYKSQEQSAWTVCAEYDCDTCVLDQMLAASISPPSPRVLVSAMCAAALYGRSAMLRWLFTFTDVDVNSNGLQSGSSESALLLAASSGNSSAVELLLEYGANVESYDQYSRGVFHWTQQVRSLDPHSTSPPCPRNLTAVVQTLVEAGADPNHGDQGLWNQRTPIQVFAVYPDQQDAVQLLLEAGADPIAKSSHQYQYAESTE